MTRLTLSVILLLLALYTKAAVVYVNPNPDITHNTNGAQNPGIDINSDGTMDVRFRITFFGGAPQAEGFYHLKALVQGGQAIMDPALGLNPGGGFPYYKILATGTAIGPASANFQTSSDPVLGDIDNSNIINAGDCYIGLKLIFGANTHYAWMRVNLTGNVNTNLVPIVVKDWAYESTPNTAIAAGDMGNGTANVAVTGITVNGAGGASTITTNGGNLQMLAMVTPANATNQNVTWSVQNGTGTANISTTGLLTAQTNGTVTVKATAQDGSNVSGTKVITISGQANNVAVTGIMVNTVSGASAITTNNGTLQMSAMVMPTNATNQNVTWSVQNGTGAATISTTGLLAAQMNGTVTVTATAQDGSNVSGNKVITISGQTVGIADINIIAANIYPNPVKGEVNLQFEQQETIYNIRISNIVGQVVYKETQVRKGALISIPAAALPAGTYILTFESTSGKQGLQKFVKQ